MAIVDLEFNAWVDGMRAVLPQAFHDETATRTAKDFRLQIAAMAFAAGRAAQRKNAALSQPVAEAPASAEVGQDGEQCRAASVSTDNEFIGEAMGRLADEVEKPGSKVTITKADACAIGIYVRALSRGVPEGE